MLTIKNFKRAIMPSILERGKDYFVNGKILKITDNGQGTFFVKVKGTKKYDVNITFDGSGNVTEAQCNCPYEYGGPCKHIAAALFALENNIEEQISGLSSVDTEFLIRSYENNAAFQNTQPDEQKVHLIPMLSIDNGLNLSFKIGYDRLYKVNNIFNLFERFQKGEYAYYGKYLAFTHTLDALDERSQKLLKLAAACQVQNYYRFSNSVKLSPLVFDEFFGLFCDEYISFEGAKCLVKFEEPHLKFKLSVNEQKQYKLTVNKGYVILGKGIRACFYDERNSTILLASLQFTNSVYELYRTVREKGGIFISSNDMPQFYSAVLKRVSECVEIKGLELAEDVIPAEMTAQLYVDCGDNNEIYANLMFNYGDYTYPAFAADNGPHYDKISEGLAEKAVLNYFTRNHNDEEHHPLVIDNDNDAYEFISAGFSELSKTMELYVSDKFRNMTVRPRVKPHIGVRLNGGLLELDISDDNYSLEELAEVLKAYRIGAKYHRLRDGSFALLNDQLSDFDDIARNLNLTTKDILKKNPTIPAYRMLYLDSLKDNKGIRLRPSAEFKKKVQTYRESIENTDNRAVPDELSDIMRDYQKYGFVWLKAIAAYGFGGILADDMGLGKTIQAISLMLDEKKRSEKLQTNLIVCPSSLTLNWESEIKKFAPQLKPLTVIGTAAVRSKQISQLQDGRYDAVITSYATLARDIDKYRGIHFRFHFIDEAQYIKNHNTQNAKAVKSIESEVRFALTGTPVENSLAELWSIFDFIMPGYLFNYTHFRKTFETPIVSKDSSQAVKALQSSVAPFILRRLKSDVLDELPDKTETVLSAPMESEQRKLYAANAAQIKKELNSGFGAKQTERVKILAMLTRLRQICCDPSLVYKNYTGKSGKLEQCMELIESCVNSGHRILLFSQFTSMLDIIVKELDEMNISYYVLTGSTKARDRIRMVNEFNENDVKVFLISLKAGGTGLNLTGADIVIHYDPWWNASAENQASDRAYRIGQKRSVQVYKLIAHRSIEENIIKLQQSKSKLNDVFLDSNADITKMSAEEIIKIIG